MTQPSIPSVPNMQLNNSVPIPQIGFGTYQIPATATQQAIEQALEIGYRHIDTDVFGFKLDPDEMQAIRALHNPAMRISGDPNTFSQSQSRANQRARGNVTA